MKSKKGLALVLALALMVSPLSLPGTVAFAETGTPAAVEEDGQTSSDDLTEAPDAGTPTGQDASPEEYSGSGISSKGFVIPVPTPTPEPEESPAPEVSPEPTDAPAESPAPTAEPEESPAPTEEPAETAAPTAEPTAEPEETAAPTAEPEESPAPTDAPEESPAPTAEPEETAAPTEGDNSGEESAEDPDDGIEVTSLLPVQDEYVYLFVNDLSSEELSAVSMNDVLARLVDRDGKPVTVDPKKNIVWGLCTNNGTQVTDDFEVILDRNAKVDLRDKTIYVDGTSYYKDNHSLVFLVSSGDQLDYEATRYFVQIYESTYEYIDYTLTVNGTNTSPSHIRYARETSQEKNGIPVARVNLYTGAYAADATVGLTVSSSLRNRNLSDNKTSNIQVKAFKLSDYLAKGLNAPEASETFFGTTGTGTFAPMKGDTPTAEEIMLLVYLDETGKKELGRQGIAYKVYPNTAWASGRIYDSRNGQLVDVVRKENGRDDVYEDIDEVNWNLDLSAELSKGLVTYYSGDSRHYYLLNDLDRTATYYYVLDPSDEIQTVYAASRYCTSVEEAKTYGKDITAQVTNAAAGYPGTFANGGEYFAVVYKNAPAEIYYMSAYSYQTQPSVPGQPSTDFHINGIDGVRYDKYYGAVEDSYDIGLDSYAYNGYITYFVWDKTTDMSKLKPTFWASSGAKVTRLDGNGQSQEQESGTEVDFSDKNKKPIQYTVTAGQKSQNYWVNFAQLSDDAHKLFVNGPSDNTRELFLVRKLNEEHNVLIANLGSEDLTNLNVTLDARSGNIKLDDYWTIEKGHHSTLKALDDSDPAQLDDQNGAYLNNLALIRILPVGDSAGLIDGTLTITADGIDPVNIKLTGISKDPTIQNKSLADGVKYVPYSQVITTDNKWQKEYPETFKITRGKLPEGLTLNEKTGEIYGVPVSVGRYRVEISVSFADPIFTGSSKEFYFNIADNTNTNVYAASDTGYDLLNAVGVDQGNYDFVVADLNQQQVFRSKGEMSEFKGFWFNGKKLVEGTDYTLSEGSTVITINSQTLKDNTVAGEPNTLAAEFREGGNNENPLHRTAQNFRLPKDGEQINTGSSGGGSSGGGSSGGGSSDSGSADSDAGTAGASGAAAAAAAVPGPQTANVSIRIVDANNVGIAGVRVELHSTPRTAVTNANGYVYFAGVGFGQHSLIVRNASGQALASTTFTLSPGTTAGYSNGVVAAVPGSGVTVTVRMANGQLTFLHAIPRTADDFNPVLWTLLAVLALCGLAGTWYWYRRRNSRG